MPGIDTAGPSAGGDELDDLFNYDIDVDAVFRDIEEKADEPSKANKIANSRGADLGIDEEVQVKKARKQIAKLDEPRLLSDRGIPKLRKITREKLKFKGKGHEFKDIARMLNLYQLWLDDLYPRAKFLDSLAMVEKLGHTKSMQVRRKDWINEDKPKDPFVEAQEELATSEATRDATVALGSNEVPSAQTPNEQAPSQGRLNDEPDNIFLSDDDEVLRDNEPDEDELDALLAEENDRPMVTNQKLPQASSERQPYVAAAAAEEDELDALLAEDEADAEKENQCDAIALKAEIHREPAADDFADEMEAIAEFDIW